MPRSDAAQPTRPLPDWLAIALQRAHAAELAATGTHRRAAFRLTRSLLGGARSAGYPVADIAACIGVSVASVKIRGGNDGLIDSDVFAAATGIPLDVVDGWRRSGRLASAATDQAGQQGYPASELIRAYADELAAGREPSG